MYRNNIKVWAIKHGPSLEMMRWCAENKRDVDFIIAPPGRGFFMEEKTVSGQITDLVPANKHWDDDRVWYFRLDTGSTKIRMRYSPSHRTGRAVEILY